VGCSQEGEEKEIETDRLKEKLNEAIAKMEIANKRAELLKARVPTSYALPRV